MDAGLWSPAKVRLSGIDDPRSFYDEACWQCVCAKCESPRRFEAHHVVQKQRCRREGAPLHSPDNALRLCAKAPGACHERHTAAQDRVPLTALRDENIAFAVRWLGAGPAYEYLVGQYAGADSRIDALLEIT